MPAKRRRKKSGSRISRIVFILLLIVAGTLLLIREPGKEKPPQSFFDRPVTVKPPLAKKTAPPLSKALPKVAIVIDDLGPNKKMAQQVLALDQPVTLSILPQQTYSTWIAEEGKKKGLDIIVHLPMEATRPLRLGEGGLYVGMSAQDIALIVEQDIQSIPHSIGASSHMGSAFTRNKQEMTAVMHVLQKKGFIFLDSLTTPGSVAYETAKARGIATLRRDVFLDDADDIREIEAQWDRLVAIAKKTGQAIAIGHPKKNTLTVLRRAFAAHRDISIVPLTVLLD